MAASGGRRSPQRRTLASDAATWFRISRQRARNAPPLQPVVWVLLVATTLLIVLGIAMVFSASTAYAVRKDLGTMSFVIRQLMGLTLGVVAAFLCFHLPARSIRKMTIFGLVVTAAALAAVFFSPPVNGARRWLEVGGFSFQPSEFAKFLLILWAAGLLASREESISDPKQNIFPIGLVAGGLCSLILFEPDLSSVLLIGAILVIMLIVAGARLDVLGLGALLLSPVVYMLMFDSYRGGRWTSLDPWSSPDDEGYQAVQSMLGINTGGWMGVGPGRSKAKWGFLPEAHTDGIFSVLGEELGLVGCLIVVIAFAAIVASGFYLATRARTTFDQLVAVGISVWIGLQALINIGVAVGALPNTGMTLPFISFGATSMVVTVASMGMLLGIARRIE